MQHSSFSRSPVPGKGTATIYADNAATTPLSPAALEAMLPWMTRRWGNPSSPHAVGQDAAKALLESRETMAGLLGCRARELTFTSGGSEADNQALLSAADWGKARGTRHIVSSAFEHSAVLRTLDYLRFQGFEITLLRPTPEGYLMPEQVAEALREDTCLVSVMLANNEIGTIQPIPEIGALCRKRGILFHTDAVQGVGHIPLEISRLNVDMLSLSAHKFHGPMGMGALYVRQGVTPLPLIRGGGQERGARAGTENVPGAVGMSAALREACARMEETTAATACLRDRLAGGLSVIPGSIPVGGAGPRLPGVLTVCFEGVEAEALLLLLDGAGICASSGSACSSGALEPSHVLRSMGLPLPLVKSAVRFSLSAENTEEEIDIIAAATARFVARLRDRQKEA